MKIEFPCKFWDTKINNPFWLFIDWLFDVWDWIRGVGDEQS